MPSRIVDDAWHEFILDSASYMEFCDQAYGEYLHHVPEGDAALDGNEAKIELVHAWDRSAAAARRETGLWDLDLRLGVERPLSVSLEFRRAVRARYGTSAGGADGSYEGDGGGDGGCGGGCGGGGCGGGG